MSWESKVPFTLDDFYGSPQSFNVDGSGAVPTTTMLVDYMLRTESDEIIQYETGEEISVEVV